MSLSGGTALTLPYEGTAQTGRMIDMDRIEELRAEIGAEDLGLIISMFLDEARATLDALPSELQRQERSRAAHFLRSGALNIGFRGVAELAARLEGGDGADAPRIVHALRDALARSRAELGMCLA